MTILPILALLLTFLAASALIAWAVRKSRLEQEKKDADSIYPDPP